MWDAVVGEQIRGLDRCLGAEEINMRRLTIGVQLSLLINPPDAYERCGIELALKS